MAGWNKDEGFNFTLLQGDDTKRPYADLARAIFNERTEALLQHYPAGSSETYGASARALSPGGDLVIIHPTWASIQAQKQSGRAEIFRFRFRPRPFNAAGVVRRA